MEITAKWNTDAKYFQLYWHDWLLERSHLRKWAIHIGVFLIGLGLALYLLPTEISPVDDVSSLILLFLGCFEIIWHFWNKRRWFKARLTNRNFGKENTFSFAAEKIHLSGPNSKGEMTWNAIEDIVTASNGIFLILQNNLSIYIPAYAVKSNSDLNGIITMFKNANEGAAEQK